MCYSQTTHPQLIGWCGHFAGIIHVHCIPQSITLGPNKRCRESIFWFVSPRISFGHKSTPDKIYGWNDCYHYHYHRYNLCFSGPVDYTFVSTELLLATFCHFWGQLLYLPAIAFTFDTLLLSIRALLLCSLLRYDYDYGYERDPFESLPYGSSEECLHRLHPILSRWGHATRIAWAFHMLSPCNHMIFQLMN